MLGHTSDYGANPDSKLAELYQAISAIACPPARSEIDPKRLAKWLSKNRGRVFEGAKIMSERKEHTKQLIWWLDQVQVA